MNRHGKSSAEIVPAQPVSNAGTTSAACPPSGIAGQGRTGTLGHRNSMHWVVGVAFRKDDCRVRVGEATQNFAIQRRITLNLLKKEKTTKLGVASKGLKAGWNSDYLSKVLGMAI